MWIFSGISQYKTNEIHLIGYFVYIFGGFNFVWLCYTILISPVTHSEFWYTVNSLYMDLLCLKRTEHTKCDSFKALRVIEGKEQNIFVSFLFQHASTEEEDQSTLEMSVFFPNISSAYTVF